MLTKSKLVNRRKLLFQASKVLAATPLLGLYACGGSDNNYGGGSSDNDSNTGTDDGASSDGGNEQTPVEESSWLSGGTNAMQVDFPPATSPFASGLGNACRVTEEFGLGPCFFDVADEKDDISEGELGVPMTLAMKLVDGNCEAIEGAVIEVWWCNAEGVYSGDNSDATGSVSDFNTGFCTGGDAEGLAARWFRGIKTTNSDGEIYFKACFPGWYPGRTTHIHFRVVLNGEQQLVSQFGFSDELADEIHVNHSDYTGTIKDTSNSTDGVFSADTVDQYLYEVERQSDGSMLAYKAIQLNV